MLEKPANMNSLGSTARWIAAARALESRREDRLFDDPWATTLAGEEGVALAGNRSPESLAPIVLRIRYFDDYLQRVTWENNLRQVVLLAAGLDTRAFRLAWPPETSIFELDQPEILREKEQILSSADAKPSCDRVVIPVDLTGSWKEALFKAGFEPGQSSAWLLEGFLFYIPNEAIIKLLDEVTNLSVPGSWLGFDIINSPTLTSPYTRQWIEMQAKSDTPWIGTLDDPAGFLSARGWKATLSQAGKQDANHGRWHLPVIPVSLSSMPHNWFLTAQKLSNKMK